MARTPGGQAHLDEARKLLKDARTAEELRRAQSVLLPLLFGLSIEQTAEAIGRSKGITCTMRTRFAKVASGKLAAPRKKTELRNHAKAELAREKEILDEVLADAKDGGIVVIPRIKSEIEAKLGDTIAISTLYRMLARHGWRKIAPDTQHPKGDPTAREEWKKNSPRTWSKSKADSA